MKNKLFRVVVLLAAVSLFVGCKSKLEDIKLTSCSVISINTKSLRTAEVVLEIGIDNPAFTFVVTNFNGIIKSGTKQAGTLSADSLTVQGKTNQKYTVPVLVELDKNLSLKEVLGVFSRQGVDGFTMDLSANVGTGKGKGRDVELNGIYLSKFLK